MIQFPVLKVGHLVFTIQNPDRTKKILVTKMRILYIKWSSLVEKFPPFKNRKICPDFE
jgi:hypothetical protein